MSAAPIIFMYMMMENNRRMQEEMEEEENRRKRRRAEEERQRKEEEEKHRKMVEHRKNAPLEYNDETWQRDRCLKAISLQPSTKELVSVVEAVRPSVIKEEENKYDGNIITVGYEYEEVRQRLDRDIETLNKLGITIAGDNYQLTRLSPINTVMAKPKQVTDYLGDTFTLRGGISLKINPEILADKSYYDKRYMDTNPDELERNIQITDTKMKKYQRFGKYLGFLLRTKKYLELEEYSKNLIQAHEKSEQRKKEMQTYRALTKNQLLAIKSYFEHLEELSKISTRIRNLFVDKKSLSTENNKDIYDLTIKKIMSMEEYSELAAQVHDYISKIHSNDEETMAAAYELVKGEYPVEVPREFIYELLISNLKKYSKEDINDLYLGKKKQF